MKSRKERYESLIDHAPWAAGRGELVHLLGTVRREVGMCLEMKRSVWMLGSLIAHFFELLARHWRQLGSILSSDQGRAQTRVRIILCELGPSHLTSRSRSFAAVTGLDLCSEAPAKTPSLTPMVWPSCRRLQGRTRKKSVEVARRFWRV